MKWLYDCRVVRVGTDCPSTDHKATGALADHSHPSFATTEHVSSYTSLNKSFSGGHPFQGFMRSKVSDTDFISITKICSYTCARPHSVKVCFLRMRTDLPTSFSTVSSHMTHSELLSLCTFSIVRYKKAKSLKLLRFENRIWFRLQVNNKIEGFEG